MTAYYCEPGTEPGERKEAAISDRGSDRQRHRALEITAETLEGRAIDFVGADRIARDVMIQTFSKSLSFLAPMGHEFWD